MTTTALAPSAGTQLAWCQPQTANEAWQLAENILASGLAPKDYRTVASIFVAMQHGAELGLNAMQALQGIALVNGRPCVWGTTLWALVQRSRLVKRFIKQTLALPAIEKLQTGLWKGRTDANATLVDALVVRISDRMDELKMRKVAPAADYLMGCAVFQVEDDIHVQLFDSVHAQKAGLLGKSGPWTQYPERMHLHRAVTYLARDACGSALTGIAGQPTAEEVIDMEGAVDTTATEVVTQQPRVDPAKTIVDMGTAQAGAPAPAPASDNGKAAASARLRNALDRLKGLPMKADGPFSAEELREFVGAKIRDLFGADMSVSVMTADQRNALAAELERIDPAPAESAEPAAVDADDADKLKF